MLLKPISSFTIAVMLGFSLLILFFFGFLDFPSVSSPLPSASSKPFPFLNPTVLKSSSPPNPFQNLLTAFSRWDSQVGCLKFREKHIHFVKINGSTTALTSSSSAAAVVLQMVDEGELECSELKLNHVGVLVKGWTWIPDNLDNLYSCRCGLSCLWTKSSVLVDKPDALLFETTTPPFREKMEGTSKRKLNSSTVCEVREKSVPLELYESQRRKCRKLEKEMLADHEEVVMLKEKVKQLEDEKEKDLARIAELEKKADEMAYEGSKFKPIDLEEAPAENPTSLRRKRVIQMKIQMRIRRKQKAALALLVVIDFRHW